MRKLKIIIIALILPFLMVGYALSYTEIFYVSATGSCSKTGASPEMAMGPKDFNNPDNWSVGIEIDGRIGPDDLVILISDCGEIKSESTNGLELQQSGLEEFPITISGEGNVVVNGSVIVTDWISSVNSVYVSTGSSWNPHQIFEDDIRLTYVEWDTDIVTTEQAMRPGTWTAQNPAGGIYYVWSTDSADPDTHLMEADRLDSVILCNNKDFIIIENLTVKKAKFTGIYLDNGSDNCIVRNTVSVQAYRNGIATNSANSLISFNTISQSGGYGINFSGSQEVIISDNIVFNNCKIDQPTKSGIYGFQGDGSLIERNKVYNNGTAILSGWMTGGGIWIDTAGNVYPEIVRENLVADNVFGIMIEKTSDAEVYANLVLDCIDDESYYQYGTGIIVLRTPISEVQNNSIRNNVLINNRIGLRIEGQIIKNNIDKDE